MSSHTPESDPRELWQHLETEGTTMPAEQIRLRAMQSLEKNRRDMIARFAFVALATAFCVVALTNAKFTSVRALAALTMALVLINAIRSLYRAYTPWSSCVEFYRRELERQQAFVALPTWQMVAALFVIAWLAPSSLRQTGLMRFVFPALLVGATENRAPLRRASAKAGVAP